MSVKRRRGSRLAATRPIATAPNPHTLQPVTRTVIPPLAARVP